MLAIAKSGWLARLIRDNKRIADFLKIPRRTDRRVPWAALKINYPALKRLYDIGARCFCGMDLRSYVRNSSLNGWRISRAATLHDLLTPKDRLQ